MQTWTRFLAQRKSRTRRRRAQKERVGTRRIGELWIFPRHHSIDLSEVQK